ncbi:NAD(P)H-binding protein [Hymenobacter sp. H14-R3]|uniref:NAD(P)H-binding protein n=1 Tax=Hymenobacter sp. H14-R3 TaxID=3046308 RepID=UPI0024BA9405|nr:NAD(P)H-binding protein [Hymenobacter sp. H14-R3]MDJ0367818.1 NAD(P)H-binding protein [Hymenobacter sp. H14-R3]
MKITLTGSLGNISKPLAEVLVQQGHHVTIISQTPDRQAAIVALGATPAIGSVTDANFLTRTFARADAVYGMVPPNFTAADNRGYYRAVGTAYAQAIEAAGVGRVVHLMGGRPAQRHRLNRGFARYRGPARPSARRGRYPFAGGLLLL